MWVLPKTIQWYAILKFSVEESCRFDEKIMPNTLITIEIQPESCLNTDLLRLSKSTKPIKYRNKL